MYDDAMGIVDYIQNSQSRQNSMLTNPQQGVDFSVLSPSVNHTPLSLSNTAYLPAFLNQHIGRLVKIEGMANGIGYERIGMLLTVGDGFIVIKLMTEPLSTLVCPLSSVNLITVLFGEDPKGVL